MRHFKLFIDMDEVLFNLSGLVTDIVNRKLGTDFKPEDNRQYWWQDFGLPQEYFEELLLEKGMFINGEPIKNSIEILTSLHEQGYEIHIITKPWIGGDCFKEKVEWIQKYLPWLNIDTNFHTSGSKHLMAASDRILVDDNYDNLKLWSMNGGVSIAFGDYGWNEHWSGFRANNWKQLERLIYSLEGVK